MSKNEPACGAFADPGFLPHGKSELLGFLQEEIDTDRWLREVEDYLEPCHWLYGPNQDGSRRLRPQGSEVVVISEGYREQYRALFGKQTTDQPQVDQPLGLDDLPRAQETDDPPWTSFRSRQQMCLGTGPVGSRLSTSLKLGPVESCTVICASYHRCIGGCLPAQGRCFVRLQLQRSCCCDQFYVVLDLHFNVTVAPFIVGRVQYEQAMRRKWRPNAPIQMWWGAPEGGGLGDWHRGKYKRTITNRQPGHPLYGSPWDTVEVEWPSNGVDPAETSCVCPWELQPFAPPRVQYLGEDSDDGREPLDMTDVFNPSDESADDEEYLADGRRSRHRHGQRQRRTVLRNISPGSPGRGSRLQRHSSDTPVTMQPSLRKTDWSAFYCGVCGDGGALTVCDGTCQRCFHHECLPAETRPPLEDNPNECWYCSDCRQGYAACQVCKARGRAEEEVFKCRMGCCGRSFHPACLASLHPRFSFKVLRGHLDERASVDNAPLFRCPAHWCFACQKSGDAMKMLRCWKCPTAYHTGCIPEGAKRYKHAIECPDCIEKDRPGSGSHPGPAVPTTQSLRDSGMSEGTALPACHVSLQQPGAAPTEPQARKRARLGSMESSGHTRQHSGAAVIGPRGPPHAASPVKLECSTEANAPEAQVASSQPCFGRVVDVQTGDHVNLVGKQRFHFGAHTKGGGCDFMIPVANIKFHSVLRVHADGMVTLNYCSRRAMQAAPIQVHRQPSDGDRAKLEPLLETSILLRSKDCLTVAGKTYMLEYLSSDVKENP